MDFIGYLCDSIARLREFAIDPRRRSAEGRTTEVDHHCGHSAIQGLLGPSTIITRYELRVGPGIYVRSAGFWIIWKETDPGITAILWYRDSSSSDLRSLFLLSSSIFFHFSGPPASPFFPSAASSSSLVGRVRKSRSKSQNWAQFGKNFALGNACFTIRLKKERITKNVPQIMFRPKSLRAKSWETGLSSFGQDNTAIW